MDHMKTVARALCLIMLGLVAPGNASAQTIGEVITKWGLVGTWAADCQQPASRSHWHITYVLRSDGGANSMRDLGDPSLNHTRAFVSARLEPDGKLEVTVDPQSPFTYLLVKGTDGRIRSLSGRLANGEYTVRDGIFTHNGQPTLWQTRCR